MTEERETPAQPGRRGRREATRVAVVRDPFRSEIVLARRSPDQGLRVERREMGEAIDDLVAGEVATTALYCGAFTNPVTHDAVKPEMAPEALTERIAELIARDPSWVLTRGPEEVACNWARAGSAKVVLTEAESRGVADGVESCEAFLDASEVRRAPASRVRFETAPRALARYCASEFPPLASRPDGASIAFLLLSRAGYGIGLYSRRTGLVHETEHAFPPDLETGEISGQVSAVLSGLLSPQSLKDLGLGPVTLMVVSVSPDLPAALTIELQDHFSNLEVEHLLPENEGVRYDQAEVLAVGLLSDRQSVTLVDLTDDLRPRAAAIAEDRRRREEQRRATSRRRAAFAVIAPVLAAVGLLIGFYAHLTARAAQVDRDTRREEQERARLRAAEEVRHSAEENFKWYLTTINQILELKAKQPSTVGLLLDLDRRWPSADPSFQVSTLHVSPQGAVEIRGSATSQEAVTQFVSALEFGGNFAGIQPEVKSNLLAAGGPVAPGGARPTLDFSVKAVYGPLAGNIVPARTPTSAGAAAATLSPQAPPAVPQNNAALPLPGQPAAQPGAARGVREQARNNQGGDR